MPRRKSYPQGAAPPNSPQHPSRSRSSRYDPTVHPDMAVALMAGGASKQELSLEMGIHPTTLYEWVRGHEEFGEAVDIGEALSLAWWLRKGRMNLANPMFNTTLWMMNMCNRHGWTRKIQGELRGSVKTQHTENLNITERRELSLDLSRLGVKQLEQLRDIVADATPVEPAEIGSDRPGTGPAKPLPFHPPALAVCGD